MLAVLVGKPITGLDVATEGHLAINVDDAQLSLRADPWYEAWQLYAPRARWPSAGSVAR